MAAEDVVLMKGNEAIAQAAINFGVDAYFGYPITPQSEVLETLAALKPWETTGMVVVQAESELAAINMVYGGAGSVGGMVIGVLIIGIISNGLNLLHVNSYWQYVAKGLIILFAVYIDMVRKSRTLHGKG